MTITAVIHEAEEGGYWAEVPSLPGCMTQGETLEGVKASLLEAVSGWMEAASDIARQKAGLDGPHGDHRGAQLIELPL